MSPKKLEKLQNIYNKYIKEALNIKDISRWAVKKTVSKAVLAGERKQELDVLDAIRDLPIREGDKYLLFKADGGFVPVTDENGAQIFYKSGAKKGQPKMEQISCLKRIEHWKNDELKEHYMERVYSTLLIFENVIDVSKFPDYTKPANKELLKDLLET